MQYNAAQGSYHGTFSLLDEASSHCPKAMGYTGLENTNLGEIDFGAFGSFPVEDVQCN